MRKRRQVYKDPEKRRADKARQNRDNPERPAQKAAWYEANKERARAYNIAWNKAHPERGRAAVASWRKANPEKSRGLSGDRRARERGAFMERVDHEAVFIRDGGVCQICDGFIGNAPWQIDHRVPLSKGGEHSYRNCQLSHALCNQIKHTKVA